MTVETRMDDPRDQFPVGMRVLAVDDDPTCLMVLETLLRKCQYHVTTTSQAIKALKMLRENKSKFDLVISDVHMPDMDGFKLLELLGLEMDLPVIMLSAYGDTKLVMKGITHGACDYLLKPVRIEELKNIWQHVIRRKKLDSKEQHNASNQDKTQSGLGGSGGIGNSDQNGKLTKKRKDQEDEEDEEHENGHDNDDLSTQKKPRVVWSVELHRKFVAAVNQLGIDKAVPKKILDLMNVEKLTRENVASHLQKYRLYLKRISCVANQQANMVAALGSADPSYLRMSSLGGLGHLQTLSGAGQFQNSSVRSFPPSGMINRLNTPAGLGMHGLPSSGVLQMGHAQSPNNSLNDSLRIQSAMLHSNQNGGSIQGMPVSVRLDRLQQNKSISVVDLTTGIDDKSILPASNKLGNPRLTISCSCNPLPDAANSALMLEAHPQDTQGGGVYKNLSSGASQNSDFCVSLLDHGRCSDNWPSVVQSSGVQTNSYPPNECFRHAAATPSDNINVGNPCASSPITALSSQSHDSMIDLHCQGAIFTNASEQMSSSMPFHGWDDHNQDVAYHSNAICSSINSMNPVNGAVGPSGHTPPNSAFNRNLDFNFGHPLRIKQDDVTISTKEAPLKQNQGYIMDQQKGQQGRIPNNLGSLEDLVDAMMKQEDAKMKQMEGDFMSNNYSSGASM